MKYLGVLFVLLSFSAFADCHVVPYGEIPLDANSRPVPIPGRPLAAAQQVTVAGAADNSSAFPVGTLYVGFVCTAKTHYRAGAAVTAVITDLYVPADETRFIRAVAGDIVSFLAGI